MTGDMDIDPPAPAAPANAMSALMAGAREKGKGKMFDGAGMNDADQKALKEKEGLPWYVFPFLVLVSSLGTCSLQDVFYVERFHCRGYWGERGRC